MKAVHALLMLLALFTVGCEQPIDVTNHFWQNVDGTYESKDNGYYISLDRNTKSVEWNKPFTVGEKPLGAVCYMTVKGKALSVGTKFEFNNDVSSVMIEAEINNLYLDYIESPTPEEETECRTLFEQNLYTFVAITRKAHIPVINYSLNALNIGSPYTCSISCEPTKSISEQDFSAEAPGIYLKSQKPF